MSDTDFKTAAEAAHMLGVPEAWLKAESKAQRIPYLKTGARRLYDIEAVRQCLRDRAAADAADDAAAADPPLLNTNRMAKRLCVPPEWLKGEALAGLIPCLRAGDSLRFDPDTTRQAVANLARAKLKPIRDPERHGYHMEHLGRKRAFEMTVAFGELVRNWQSGNLVRAEQSAELLRWLGADVRACQPRPLDAALQLLEHHRFPGAVQHPAADEATEGGAQP